MESWDLDESCSSAPSSWGDKETGSSKPTSKLSRKRKHCPATTASISPIQETKTPSTSAAMTSTQAVFKDDLEDEEEEKEVLTKTKRGTRNSEGTHEDWEERAFRRQLQEAIRRSQQTDEKNKKKEEKKMKEEGKVSLKNRDSSKKKKKSSKKSLNRDDDDHELLEDEEFDFRPTKRSKLEHQKNTRDKKNAIDSLSLVVDDSIPATQPLAEQDQNSFSRIRIQETDNPLKLKIRTRPVTPEKPFPSPVPSSQEQNNHSNKMTNRNRHSTSKKVPETPEENQDKEDIVTNERSSKLKKKVTEIKKILTKPAPKQSSVLSEKKTTSTAVIVAPPKKPDPPRCVTPKWTAPRMIRSSTSTLSTPTGTSGVTPHRVGLSRNFKALKPLHSKVKLNVGD